ncbi:MULTISPECIES: hypothetical protein [unclassified Frankia]|uniref:hypothetical protein n=1 Tax=unclassified Frankia TaxID=2632575 RepID=UPI00030B0CA0|nr:MULTISPECIES: hypothetical protein [unclassified Frankia]
MFSCPFISADRRRRRFPCARRSEIPISEPELDTHVFEGVKLPPLGQHEPKKLLDREHTHLFLAELERRYPNYQHNATLTSPFLAASITAINLHPRITRAVVTHELSQAEAVLGMANTDHPRPVPATQVERLIDWLEAHRGDFTWQGEPEQNQLGGISDYQAWLNGPTPLANPPGPDTRLICWEVVLLAAANVGIYSVAQLRTAYAGNKLAGTFALFSTHGRVDIQNNGRSGFAVANQIQAGDAIMIKSTAADFDHVVVAASPDPANLRNIEVLSLWNRGTGGVLGRTLLDNLIIDGVTAIRHARL